MLLVADYHAAVIDGRQSAISSQVVNHAFLVKPRDTLTVQGSADRDAVIVDGSRGRIRSAVIGPQVNQLISCQQIPAFQAFEMQVSFHISSPFLFAAIIGP